MPNLTSDITFFAYKAEKKSHKKKNKKTTELFVN